MAGESCRGEQTQVEDPALPPALQRVLVVLFFLRKKLHREPLLNTSSSKEKCQSDAEVTSEFIQIITALNFSHPKEHPNPKFRRTAVNQKMTFAVDSDSTENEIPFLCEFFFKNVVGKISLK